MFKNRLSVQELAFIAVTRVALGVGIGFLLSGKLRRSRRKRAGIALAIAGGLTTIPLAIRVRSLRKTNRLAA